MQRLVQLVALCPVCHQTQHFGRSQLEGFEEVVSEQVAKVNGWSDEEVEKDKARAGNRYVALRDREWDLDLSVLTGQVSIAGYPGLVIPAAERAALAK